MKRFRFLEWQVYKDAQKLLGGVIDIVKRLPKEYCYEMDSRISRAVLSVILNINIAEGSARSSGAEMSRFFVVRSS